jgi:hypothetical protein
LGSALAVLTVFLGWGGVASILYGHLKDRIELGGVGMELTPKEIRDRHAQFSQESKRLDKEYAEMTNSALHFQRRFVDLEVALSALLQAILNGLASQVAYAIYYSPTGFHARADIVSNALLQHISEHNELDPLRKSWARLKEVIEAIRENRNYMAHGTPLRFAIRNKTHLRFAPPAFDILRVGRPLQQNRIPGLSAGDITFQVKRLGALLECINDLHLVVEAHHKKDATLSEKFAQLEKGLRELESP